MADCGELVILGGEAAEVWPAARLSNIEPKMGFDVIDKVRRYPDICGDDTPLHDGLGNFADRRPDSSWLRPTMLNTARRNRCRARPDQAQFGSS